jgi:multidrug efflux pump subunit AcrA (membrane-fusion protein)
MKKNKLIFMICLIAALVGFGLIISKRGSHDHGGEQGKQKDLYYCPMHPQITDDKPGDCPICYMKLIKREPSAAKRKEQKDQMVQKEKKILYWTDPMIPGYKSDKPGKSPMNMDLIPVYENDEMATGQMGTAEGHASIELTPQKQQLIGIKTASVKRQSLTKTIRTVGTVAHDPELYQAQVEYIQAIQTLKQAQESGSSPEILDQLQGLLDASRTRLRHMGISEDLINEMATWKEPQHSLLYAHPGQPVWIYAQVYQYELPYLHTGDEVEVTEPSLSGKILKGTIKAIDLMVDQTTRTTRVRILVEDHNGLLRPDMYVDITIHINLGDTLTVPQEAVFDTGIQKIVFIDQGEGVLAPRDVTLGARTEGFYEIKEGLKEGEKVVISGNFLIDSESRLKAALEGMTQDSSSGEETMPEGSHGGQHVQ